MKTFSTSGTGNQQTLSEIESNNVPIYDSLADVTADLANLTVGQIVATKDTGDELSQPVNVVEEGNLHAVSSNAVANACPKYPDYVNQIAIASGTSMWTATEDCFVQYAYAGTTDAGLFIDNHKVSVSDMANSTYTVQFSGYVKKGSIVSGPSALGSDRGLFRAFPLI